MTWAVCCLLHIRMCADFIFLQRGWICRTLRWKLWTASKCTENKTTKNAIRSKTYPQSCMNKAHFVFQFSISASCARYLIDEPFLIGWCFLMQAASFAGKMFKRSGNSENCWWSDQLYVVVGQKCKTEWSGEDMVTICTTKHITNKKVTTQGSCVLNFQRVSLTAHHRHFNEVCSR